MNEMEQSMRDLENERQNLEQMDNIMREMRRVKAMLICLTNRCKN